MGNLISFDSKERIIEIFVIPEPQELHQDLEKLDTNNSSRVLYDLFKNNHNFKIHFLNYQDLYYLYNNHFKTKDDDLPPIVIIDLNDWKEVNQIINKLVKNQNILVKAPIIVIDHHFNLKQRIDLLRTNTDLIADAPLENELIEAQINSFSRRIKKTTGSNS